MMPEQRSELLAAERALPEIDWRTKAYLVGGLAGAIVGVGAAYLYVNAAEQGEDTPDLKPGEAVGIGLAVLALLRQIAGLRASDDKDKKKKKR
jgi:hypothetical protein